ncbi:hypothetical protein Kpho02_32930 [Kitasatospora phosalacinea]|uniref:Uncharacterized protein n=1 Tax=Kitasatospora phosalacinea TaxID=2065 RepID=A0A9W6Q743_9ACTN|nr:hypothetical protein [Kitasatospora phosalacinea]GLW70994.1 hypothetical protein Kpho02_32930 [Kitasatospora phosalacinea]
MSGVSAAVWSVGAPAKVVLERSREAAPAPLRLAHRQARHELELLCSLILANPASAATLTKLVDSDVERPEGALVLGVLLNLADYEEGARFWWEFAAGGGSHLAASCLWFWHQSRGEPRDAQFWRHQAEKLADEPQPQWRMPSPERPLVPRRVRADILARCKEGLAPRLPARMAAVLKSLPVQGDHHDWPEVPHWTPDVVCHLKAAAENC